MPTPLVVAALGGCSVLLTFVGISIQLRSRQAVHGRLMRVIGVLDQAALASLGVGYSTGIWRLVKKLLAALGEAGMPHDEEELAKIQQALVQAGYRGLDAPVIFCGAKVCTLIFLPAVFGLLRIWMLPQLSLLHTLFIFLLCAVLGLYTPRTWLQMKTKRRQRKILDGFPDALDLMVVCVEAGLGLDAALSRVGEEMELMHPALGEEFKVLNLELRVGMARDKALKNLSYRIDLEDIHSLVALLIQTGRFGTSVATALRVHSDAMRIKRYQRAEETAAKLPVKLLLPLIFFILPSLFVVILGPGVVQMSKTLLPALGK